VGFYPNHVGLILVGFCPMASVLGAFVLHSRYTLTEHSCSTVGCHHSRFLFPSHVRMIGIHVRACLSMGTSTFAGYGHSISLSVLGRLLTSPLSTHPTTFYHSLSPMQLLALLSVDITRILSLYIWLKRDGGDVRTTEVAEATQVVRPGFPVTSRQLTSRRSDGRSNRLRR